MSRAHRYSRLRQDLVSESVEGLERLEIGVGDGHCPAEWRQVHYRRRLPSRITHRRASSKSKCRRAHQRAPQHGSSRESGYLSGESHGLGRGGVPMQRLRRCTRGGQGICEDARDKEVCRLHSALTSLQELAGNRWHIDCFRCHTCGKFHYDLLAVLPDSSIHRHAPR